MFNPLSSNPRKWSNTLKQFVGDESQKSQYHAGLAATYIQHHKITSLIACSLHIKKL